MELQRQAIETAAGAGCDQDTPRNHPSPAYAAIDLGTHNCRMLIAKPRGRGLRVLGSFSRIVRLGEAVACSGKLCEDAMLRTLDALTICAQKMEAHGVLRSRSVATAACRLAGNSPKFLERVRAETGLDLEVISAKEEARLTLMGCVPLVSRRAERALLLDIGGGSTEVAWIETNCQGDVQIIDMISLDMGVVSLAEEFGDGHLSDENLQTIVARVEVQLRPFDARNDIMRTIQRGGSQMIGTSGTVTTLGALSLGLNRYDRRRVDGLKLSFDHADLIGGRLMRMSKAQRAEHPAIGVERVGMVGVGCAIMKAICDFWPLGRMTVADRGIREGALLELMALDRRAQAAE
ncbi:MAG: Ppx/GppA family phosphatase [Magnetospiraceae bacterium]